MHRISQEEFHCELERIIESLKEYEPQKIILFGSFARGDYNVASDIDLIVIKDTDRRFIERIGDVLAFCESRIAVKPLVYTPAELEEMLKEGNSFLEKALREGIIVYESE
jgi:predicted nucleotidyltransferase